MSSMNKEIHLGGKPKYPSKKSINLLIEEKHTKQNVAAILLFLVYLVLLALFTRYAVIGQLNRIDELHAAYDEEAAQVEAMKEANSGYEAVRAEYSHYGNGYLNDEERAMQDRMAILGVIEDQLLPSGAVQNISVSENVATLTINSEKLKNVSEIVTELESQDIVSYVTVTQSSGSQTEAAAEEAEAEGETAAEAQKNVTSTMTIYFEENGAEAEEASTESTESTEASTESATESAEASTVSATESAETSTEAGTEAAEASTEAASEAATEAATQAAEASTEAATEAAESEAAQ